MVDVVNYGVVMKRKLYQAFGLSLTVSLTAFALVAQVKAEGNFELNEEKSEALQLKEPVQNTTTTILKENQENAPETPEIVREETENGYIEKLITPDGKIIAEKTIENDKLVRNILNYYTPDGKLARRVSINEQKKNFFAQEYYPNGKIASTATYINENTKIGKEKKYDINGILRQELTWVLPQKNIETQTLKTIRYGKIITYYPNGAKAAEFAVGAPATTIFYSPSGQIIKQINNSEILNFSEELNAEDCKEKAIQLSLKDLVELYEDEGDIAYNKCGLPYRETFIYEVLDETKDRTIKISYDETGQIRRITPYKNGIKEGVLQKFDASGNLTAEIPYKNGKKHGSAIGYFPTKERAFQKNYENGQVVDTLTCFFPDGKVAAEFHYQNGLKEGVAKIHSPIEKELEFSEGEMLNEPESETQQTQASRLGELDMIDEKCLNAENKITSILAEIENTKTKIQQRAFVEQPKFCQDLGLYQTKGSQQVCYDENRTLRAQYQTPQTEESPILITYYTPEKKIKYTIPYVKNNRQGIAKKYDNQGNVIAEAYYQAGWITDTARSYYPTGVVHDVYANRDGTSHRIWVEYDQNGNLIYNLSYSDGQKVQAYMANPKQNKDVFVRFNEGKLENIREVNNENPLNYIEYNLKLGEYIVARDGELIKGGYLCRADENKLTEKSDADNKLRNAIIPTEEEKKQAELAAKNIGPVAKPDIENLTSVAKESHKPAKGKHQNTGLTKTEKLYYPNGSVRKTIKTKGGRTEEIKEYSKSGLLLNDTIYHDDGITVEKYFGTGAIRRKTNKSYEDNAISAFISREDFYDNGTPRYIIARTKDNLLFEERKYALDGSLKTETLQQYPLSLQTKEYNTSGEISKITQNLGTNKLVKEFDEKGKIKTFSLNGKKLPVNMATNAETILSESGKIYDKSKLLAEIKAEKNKNTILEYYPENTIKIEIVFYNSGEISVKEYDEEGTLVKFATLTDDGKLYIQKPEVRVIPNYRERYWLDYNNPYWIENEDRYSIKYITRLYLDITTHILAELDIPVPVLIQQLYTEFKS